jgi:hypothetical protein
VVVDSAGQFIADMSDDGLHPNPKGYRVMAPLVLDAVQKASGRPASPEPQQQKPEKRRLFSR